MSDSNDSTASNALYSATRFLRTEAGGGFALLAGAFAALSTRTESAALPILAALGGVLVPIAIFLALAGGEIDSTGWGIPMATDAAFAIGVLAILGDRVSIGVRLFLVTIAVGDGDHADRCDVGGVHATLAGVALGLLTPARPIEGRRVLEELEEGLHPYVSFLILPLFALANAGVELGAPRRQMQMAGA
jgi:Na+:H+ antiporter, NhaA family